MGATDTGTPLVYDFGGFPERYYRTTYRSPGAPDLAARVKALMPDTETVVDQPRRGLDHGAYVPLTVMYPDADIPVLQMSLPTLDPEKLLALGRRLAPLRDEGVLILGSGFLTHGLPFLRDFSVDQTPPGWSTEFDGWAGEALARGAIDELAVADALHQLFLLPALAVRLIGSDVVGFNLWVAAPFPLAALGAWKMGALMSYFDKSYSRAGATIVFIYLVGMALIWLAPETKGKPLPE
jgi:hypothetical protein